MAVDEKTRRSGQEKSIIATKLGMSVTTGRVRASKHRYEKLTRGGRGSHRITNVSPVLWNGIATQNTQQKQCQAFALLKRDAASFGSWLPTFQDNLSVL
jgi:hypothetical protein